MINSMTSLDSNLKNRTLGRFLLTVRSDVLYSHKKCYYFFFIAYLFHHALSDRIFIISTDMNFINCQFTGRGQLENKENWRMLLRTNLSRCLMKLR